MTMLEFVGYLFIYVYVFIGIGYMIARARRESVTEALSGAYDGKLADPAAVEAHIEEYDDAAKEAEDED